MTDRTWTPMSKTAACQADMCELCTAYNCECDCHWYTDEEDDEIA